MRVIIHASDTNVAQQLADALHLAGWDVDAMPVLAEFRTELYRDRDALGVLWTETAEYAALTTREFRVDGIRNLLFALIDDAALADEAKRVPTIIRILGLGADEVQRFPIDERELVARVRALTRRERPPLTLILLPNDAYYRPDLGKLFHPGGQIWLTGKERNLLNLLVGRPDTVFTKEMILDGLYDGRDEPTQKIVDVFVCKLRKKLELALGGIDVIATAWGRGYQFVPEGLQPILRHTVRAAR